MSLGSTDISDVFENYDQFWKWFFILHAICCMGYGLIFYITFTNAIKRGETPKDCLLMSTCSISTIHSHICCIGAIVGFFVDGLYKKENYMISTPGIISVIWMLWTSYMLTDLFAHLICFYLKPIPARYDVIFHHLFAYLTVYLLNFPAPIYGWLILCAPLITEFSTIFMNFRWFAKHYHYSYQLQYNLNAAFLITWFVIRLPAILSLLIYLILHWNTIYSSTSLIPIRVAISGTLLIICINILHIIWAFLLIKKIRKNKYNKQSQIKQETETDSLLS